MDDCAHRICRSCQVAKPMKAYDRMRNGRRATCHTCHARHLRASNPTRMNALQRDKRQRLRASAVLSDCRSSDRKNGRVGNDLTREVVAALIDQPCSYCATNELKMTLDRIDNGLAHTITNVRPACIRCNFMRGSMPYEAWLHIVPAVRSAAQQGLFGDWRSMPLRFRALPQPDRALTTAKPEGRSLGSTPRSGSEATHLDAELTRDIEGSTPSPFTRREPDMKG